MTAYNLQPLFINFFFDPVTGDRLIYGTLESWKATDHSTHKAIYETDVITYPNTVPPEYTNPIELNGAGSVGRLYYADDEPYYLKLRKQDDTLVMSIDNYPSSDEGGPVVVTEFDPTNYMLNPQFRFHYQETYENDDDLDTTDEVYVAADNWVFKRNNTNATNTITFPEFILGQSEVPENPKYHFRYQCTSIGAGSETHKDILLKIRGVESFSNDEITLSFQAKSSTSSSIQIAIIQHFGTGGSPSSDVPTLVIEQLDTDWDLITVTTVIPDVDGKILGDNDDDYLYVGIRLPLNSISEVDLVNFQMNKGDELLVFNYKTYEMGQIDKKPLEWPDLVDNDVALGLIVTSPRQISVYHDQVGEISWHSKEASVYGKLLCNGEGLFSDSYIDETGGVVQYRRLNNVVGNIWGYGAKTDAQGSDGYRPLNLGDSATDTLVATNTYIGTISNWSANDSGFTVTTLNPGWTGGLGFIPTQDDGVTIRCRNNATGDVTDASAQTSGFTVTKIQDGSSTKHEIATIVPTDTSSITPGDYFFISSTTDDYYVWLTIDGVGTDPAVGGRTGIQVDLTTASGFTTARHNAVLITEALEGHHTTKITFAAASTLSGGESFFAETDKISSGLYYWYKVNGAGTDPAPSGRTGILVADLAGTETAEEVRDLTTISLASSFYSLPDPNGAFFRAFVSPTDGGLDPDFDNRILAKNFNGYIGTFQQDEFESHNHTGTTYSKANTTSGPDFDGGGFKYATSAIPYDGGSESRPVNFGLVPFIKY